MPSCTTARRILTLSTIPNYPTISFDSFDYMPNQDGLGSRRRLLVRQKGYQNLNVVALDAIYPRSSHTRSPSFRRLRGIEEPPVLPTSPLHQFGCPPASATMSSSSSTTASSSKSSLDREEHHSKVQEAVAAITQHKDISMPSLSQSPSPRKLPVVPNLEDASIPGATWQRVPSYSYSRGVDTPPYFPPYRPAATTIKSKSTTKKSTSSRHMMDPTESVRRGYGFRSESTRSYCGSSLSSYETKRGRAAVRLEFQTPSMRSLSSYQYNRYTYSPGREDGHSPRTQSYGDDIQEYRSYLMEEPDYYYDEEEEEEVTYRDDHLMPQLMDSGGSSRGVDTSSSSSSSVSNMVDIGDGTQMRLRGADETWRAVENDFYAPGVCTCCQTTVFCIQDADYFICPGCRVISPLNEDSKSAIRGGGVGLGFTFEELSRWQQEMTNDRSLVR